MSHTRWRAAAFLAVLSAVVITVGSGVALWFVTAVPVHPDTAAVPSRAGAQVERYADAIAEGRRLARALVVNENVPGLSVAVAADGEIVWAEGFGWANVDGARAGHAAHAVPSRRRLEAADGRAPSPCSTIAGASTSTRQSRPTSPTTRRSRGRSPRASC